MEFFSIPILLDLALICLLVATISYCIVLSRKLSTLRAAQSDLKKVAGDFDRALVRSRLGIEELKKESRSVGESLQKEKAEAKSLLEELQLINAASSRIADRLQAGATAASGGGKQAAGAARPSATPAASPDMPEGDDALKPRTEAERELLQMLTRPK